jgi:hypothetical protein
MTDSDLRGAGVQGAAGAVTGATGTWANVPVMDIVTVTPTAVAAMVTVIVEPVKRSSMMISL